MPFRFRDSLENVRTSPYYKYLQDNIVLNIGEKGLKKDYLISQGFRYVPDENKVKDRLTDEQFSILLKIEQTYHDDFVRIGCERFWGNKFTEKQRNYHRKVLEKRKVTAPFFF